MITDAKTIDNSNALIDLSRCFDSWVFCVMPRKYIPEALRDCFESSQIPSVASIAI